MGLRKHPFRNILILQIRSMKYEYFVISEGTHLVNNRGEIKADFGFRLRVVCFMPSSVHVKALKLFHNFSHKMAMAKNIGAYLEDKRMYTLKVVKRITVPLEAVQGKLTILFRKLKNVSLTFSK